MKFRVPKRYGQSKENHCAFCGGVATQKNKDGLLVCRHHLQQKMDDIKCTCGAWLEQKVGKFGPYYNCRNCGNINFNKAMELKSLVKVEMQVEKKVEINVERRYVERIEREPRETTISTDDVEYFS